MKYERTSVYGLCSVPVAESAMQTKLTADIGVGGHLTTVDGAAKDER